MLLLMCLSNSSLWVKVNNLEKGFALRDWGQDRTMKPIFKIGFLNLFSKEPTFSYHEMLKFGGLQSIVYPKKYQVK